MEDLGSFTDLLARVRAGNEQAANDLVRIYEPQIRRIIRIRLTTRSLRRQMDSTDICQSVMGDFFVRVAMGQFNLERPAQLVRLLATKHSQRDRGRRRFCRIPGLT